MTIVARSLSAVIAAQLIGCSLAVAAQEPWPASSAPAQDSRSIHQDSGENQVKLSATRERIVELLDSPEAKDRAWGAYLSGQYERRDLIPRLWELFGGQLEQVTYEESLTYHVALDTLIRLNASIPPELLRLLLGRFRAETIILALKLPKERQSDLLGLMRGQLNDSEWLALGNSLSEWKTPGFTAMLMGEIRISVHVAVFEDANHGIGFGSGGGTSCCLGSSSDRVPAGFPPVAVYRLDQRAGSNSVVLSNGRHHPIYYERAVFKPGSPITLNGCGNSTPRDPYRLDYLAEMLGTTPERLPIKHDPSYSIVWSGTEQYLSEMSWIRSEVRGSYKMLVGQLAEEGLLTPDEANSLKPHLSIKVTDARDDKSVPLPPNPKGAP